MVVMATCLDIGHADSPLPCRTSIFSDEDARCGYSGPWFRRISRITQKGVHDKALSTRVQILAALMLGQARNLLEPCAAVSAFDEVCVLRSGLQHAMRKVERPDSR